MRLSQLRSARTSPLPPHRGARARTSAWVRAATAAATLGATAVHAQSAPRPQLDTAALGQRVTAAIERAGLGDRIGVSLRELPGGRELVAHHAALALRPASNLKLLTAAACLGELGAEFRLQTGLYGRIKAGALEQGLYLKGFGDPTLRHADLYELARLLFARGVRSISEVVVDGTQFDDQSLPPGFDEQPHEYAPFRAAVAAVSVEENAYTLQVEAGANTGAAALVRVSPAAHFVVDNRVTTSARGPLRVRVEQHAQGERLAVSLTGSIPLGMGPVSYRRRIEAPLPHAGAALVEALRAAGIEVRGGARIAAMPAGLPLLVSHASPPLAEMLGAVGKYSDNFVAEMLLKVLAAERAPGPATSARGAAIALDVLHRRFGVRSAEIQMVNGSGLFGDSRISAAALTQLLSGAYSEAALRPEFIAQLAIGGADGTLAQRMTALPHARIVRAKTGTLEDVIALSGYVLGPTPERAIAFSLLLNGIRGKQPAARALADEIVQHIATSVWSGQMTAQGGQMPASNGQLPAAEVDPRR